MTGYCLDAGALIGLERGDPNVGELIADALRRGHALDVPAGVLAQVWRGGPRQARLANLLGADEVSVVALEAETARLVGILCGATGTTDVVDAHVALHARVHGLAVLTSDPEDLAAFGGLEVVAV